MLKCERNDCQPLPFTKGALRGVFRGRWDIWAIFQCQFSGGCNDSVIRNHIESNTVLWQHSALAEQSQMENIHCNSTCSIMKTLVVTLVLHKNVWSCQSIIHKHHAVQCVSVLVLQDALQDALTVFFL